VLGLPNLVLNLSLKGAKNHLIKHVIGVEVEVFFVEIYKNSPLVRDINLFLTECGFKLIKQIRKSNNIFNDFFYIKQNTENIISGSLFCIR